MPAFSKKSRQPLYFQLKSLIEARIESGEWKPGAQVPSERELCEQFKISRITVRHAIAELVNEGRLTRAHGRGTFVAKPQVEQRLAHLTGFTQDMEARSRQAGARVLQNQIAPAPPNVARALQIQPGDPVVVVRRLRLADGEPMAIETAHLLDNLCHDLIQENLENRSLYKTLRDQFNVIPARANQQMQAIACPPAEAKLLGLRKGSPVLRIYRTTYADDNIPFEYVESIYRGDKYVFHAELNHI